MSRSIAFFCQVLVFLAMTPCSVIAQQKGVIMGDRFGGPHGADFSDVKTVSSNQTVQSVTVNSGDRVNSISITFKDPKGKVSTLSHGGGGGKQHVHKLAKGEYFQEIEAHMGKKNGRTRIQYISFTTNRGNVLTGGTKTKDIGKDDAPYGFQLGGFFGASGHELDAVGAIWTALPSQVGPPVVSKQPALH